jgi:hypothetical protein
VTVGERGALTLGADSEREFHFQFRMLEIWPLSQGSRRLKFFAFELLSLGGLPPFVRSRVHVGVRVQSASAGLSGSCLFACKRRVSFLSSGGGTFCGAVFG